MSAMRNFSLKRSNGAVPAVLESVVVRAVVAGEACTELGCDAAVPGRAPWFVRWLGLGRKADRGLERNGHGTSA